MIEIFINQDNKFMKRGFIWLELKGKINVFDWSQNSDFIIANTSHYELVCCSIK